MQATAPSRNLDLVLGEELAGGTFARVYRAELALPGGGTRPVAVKVLKERWEATEEVVARTRDEARLLARLRHPHLVRVEDAFEVDGRLAMVMELVDGADLRQVVEALARERATVPPRVALAVGAAVARALKDAHDTTLPGEAGPLRLVHRDIKPPNVMVDRAGGVKVLDFGTARTDEAGRFAQTGNVRFGSLKYMSPERREGDRGDVPSDVYALGMVLVEVLRGSWLPALPLDPEEHDEAVAGYVAALGDLAMPDPRWDEAIRQLLRAMLRADAARRMPIDRAVELLDTFAGQAGGPTLAEWAAGALPGILDGLAAQRRRGEWTGRHLQVGVTDLAAAPVPAAMPAPRLTADPVVPPLPEPEPEPPRGGGATRWMVAIAVGLLVGGTGALFAAGFWLTRPEPPPPPPAVELPAELATVLAAAVAPVRVVIDAPRVGLVRLDGTASIEGQGGLAGAVPPGEGYTLRVDLGGRTVASPVVIPAGGLALRCAPVEAGLGCGAVELR